MCRLPLDLMTRIIELVRVPLPWAGDRDVTWNDLRQPGLATLMRVSRMTYFIAAPLLYKKLAINNLASFFLGVDDDIQPHHHGCSDPQSKQARICKWVIKKDGVPYQCHRHPINTLITPTVNESTPSKSGIFHKQQLLQLVEEVYFVYAKADRYILGQVEIEDHIDEDGNLDKEIIQHVDIGRYMNVPECIESGSIGDVLPNLKRMTVAGWLSRKYNTNSIANSIPSHVHSAGPLHQFERHLAQTLYQFTPTFICHYPSSGFLRQYPSCTKRICVNIIHEAEPVTFGTYLRPGADNFVHFDDLFKSSPFEMFVESIDVIADELVETMNRWHESNDEASSRIR